MSNVLLFQRLPYLAQDEVLKSMNLFEKFTLSTLSAKTRNIVKRCLGNRHSFHLDVDYYIDYLSLKFTDEKYNDESLVLEIRNLEKTQDEPPTFEWIIFKKTFPFAKVASEFEIVIAYFEKKFEGVKLLITYLTDVFKNVVVSLDSCESDNFLIVEVMNHVKELNLKVKRVKMISDQSDKLHKEVLDECREVSHLFIDCDISPNFEYNNMILPPFQLDTLYIMQANWVNVWHLNNLFIDCKNLNLDNCNIDGIQMFTFLRRWIKGSKMENLDITYKGSLDAMITDDFPATEVRKATIFRSPKKFQHGGCFLLRQNNGVEAIIYKIGKRFILTTQFKINENDNDDDEED